MHLYWILLVLVSVVSSISPAQVLAAPPPPTQSHPQILAVDHWWDFDWSLREYALNVAVAVELDEGSHEVAGTIIMRGVYPYAENDWDIRRSFETAGLNDSQLVTLERYSVAILGCQWHLPAAHVYDDPDTHNPLSPISIYQYAEALWWMVRCPQYGQMPPPPMVQGAF
jgi:hypothetical protein